MSILQLFIKTILLKARFNRVRSEIIIIDLEKLKIRINASLMCFSGNSFIILLLNRGMRDSYISRGSLITIYFKLGEK